MGLRSAIERAKERHAKVLEQSDEYVVLTMMNSLTDMGVPHDSKTGQYVIEHMRPVWNGHPSLIEQTYGPEAVFEWLTELDEGDIQR